MGRELKNLKPITFSFVVSLAISFIFLMATFYILAFSDPNAMKDALSTTGSYFGAASTLGAAVIAAYLFNDWREQHNKIVESEYLREALVCIRDIEIIEKRIRVALKQTTSVLGINYNMLQNIDYASLLNNCRKVVQLLEEYSKLTGDKEMEFKAAYFNEFSLAYWEKSLILQLPESIAVNVKRFMDDRPACIQGVEYDDSALFNGINVVGLKTEVLNRIPARK